VVMTLGTAQVRGPYRKGIERRAQIVRSASEVFAVLGYSGGSLRAIADRVGTSSATLIQLFGSKEGLLMAVLDDWTEQSAEIVQPGQEGLAFFQAIRGLMDFHLEHRGLLELFITLAAEASNPDHPAREFIQQRYQDTIAEWSAHLRLARDRGEVAGMTDEQIDGEIQSLLAIADGLELQWLLNPQIELPGRFNAYLDQAIHRWQEAPQGST
jgi:AcrR family transcriptional regulator